MTSSDQAEGSGKPERSLASRVGGLAMGLLIAVLIIVLSSWLLPGDWPIAGVILAVLVGLGSVIQFFTEMRHSEAEGQFARSFPGYRGERLPIFALLHYQGPEGAMQFDPSGVEFSLGVAPRYLFVIRHGRASDPKEAGGSLVDGPDGRPLRIRRDEIADVGVEALTDSQIAEAAGGGAEWVSNLVTSNLFGASVRTIPYAALVNVVVARADGVAVFRIGIPTEIRSEAAQSLAAAVTGAVAGQAQDLVMAQLGEELAALVGQDAADLFLGGGTLALSALGGGADGSKGRLVAALLAARIRQLALATAAEAEGTGSAIPAQPGFA